MNRVQLLACTRKQLADLARDHEVAGWHGMRKEDLVEALVKIRRRQARKAAASERARRNPAKAGKKLHAPVQRTAARNTAGSPEEQVEKSKYDVGVPTRDLSARIPKDLPTGYGKDRIVALVRDPYWLHCYWEVTQQTTQRAEAALGQDWHGSKPILRVYDVTSSDTSNASEKIVRDIEIHGGCNNWYIDVNAPPRSFRIDIGYLSRNGRFYVLSRSNIVTTPRAGISEVLDENWADLDSKKADRIYAMSSGYDPSASSLEVKQFLDERLPRPLGSPSITSFGSGGLIPMSKGKNFTFKIDAELVVYGNTEPNARVTLQGQPVNLRSDGSFTMRFKMPDARQIIKAEALSPDGFEQRTIVLSVERNTKELEPLLHEEAE